MIGASRTRYQFDADAAVLLRDITDGAETATALEAGVSLNELDTAYWHDGDIPGGVIAVVINVSECAADDAALAAETYLLELLVDDVAALNDSPVVVGTCRIPPGVTGTFYMYVDAKTIPVVDPDTSGTDKYIGIRATLTGEAASITYGAWIAKSLRG